MWLRLVRVDRLGLRGNCCCVLLQGHVRSHQAIHLQAKVHGAWGQSDRCPGAANTNHLPVRT